MAVSTTALIQRVRNYLDERPYVSTGTVTTAGDTSCDVTDGTAWEEGAIIEFQDNGEQCLVTAPPAGNTLTVVRGWNGTTATAHSSVTIFRDPIYTYNTINQALLAAVKRLWPYAYKVGTDTITPDPATTVWYELNSDFMDPVSFRQQYGATGAHFGTFGQKNSGHPVVWERNLPTALVSTGIGARFPYGFWSSTDTVDVVYRTVITGTSDIEDDGELNVADAVIHGALSNLFLGLEGQRVGQGEDLEPARSVRTGARSSLGQAYESMFRTELQQLKIKHEALYPPMRTK